jgi:hypothetical protein
MRKSSPGLVLILLLASGRSFGQAVISQSAQPSELPATVQSDSSASAKKSSTAQTSESTQATSADTSAASMNDPAAALRDNHAGPPQEFWFRGSYLLFWIKQGPLNTPLVTTGPTTSDGNLSDSRTQVLFGNSDFDYGRFSGMKYDLGGWLSEQHIWGLEGSGFLLEQRADGASFASDANGNPMLSRPFTNISTVVNGLPSGTPAGYRVAFPGAFAGNVNVQTTSRLWGAEVNVVRNLAAGPGCTFDLLAGFRYLDLDEQLTIANQSTELANGVLFFNSPVPLPTGSILGITDHFRTRNQFYGGQGGAQAEFCFGAFTFDVKTTVALGPNHEIVGINGLTSALTPDGVTRTLPSGLFALTGTNVGRITTNWFAIAPEVELRFGYHFGQAIFAYVGYNFLYLNNVVRPGTEVNMNVNPAFVPSSISFNPLNQKQAVLAQPSLLTQRDDFWAQGLQFGVEFKY